MSNDTLKSDLTVNELISSCPETVEVFNRLGIDACCGGDVPPRQAAVRDGVDVELLMTQLHSVMEATS